MEDTPERLWALFLSIMIKKGGNFKWYLSCKAHIAKQFTYSSMSSAKRIPTLTEAGCYVLPGTHLHVRARRFSANRIDFAMVYEDFNM